MEKKSREPKKLKLIELESWRILLYRPDRQPLRRGNEHTEIDLTFKRYYHSLGV
jgi:hypothetical protein